MTFQSRAEHVQRRETARERERERPCALNYHRVQLQDDEVRPLVTVAFYALVTFHGLYTPISPSFLAAHELIASNLPRYFFFRLLTENNKKRKKKDNNIES